MVKRCAWGRYNTYTRYHERIGNGVYLIPFPKLKQGRAKCLRWIQLCGRPQSTLRSLAICHTLVRLDFSSAKAINYAYMIIGILIIHIIVIDSTGLLSPLMLY